MFLRWHRDSKFNWCPKTTVDAFFRSLHICADISPFQFTTNLCSWITVHTASRRSLEAAYPATDVLSCSSRRWVSSPSDLGDVVGEWQRTIGDSRAPFVQACNNGLNGFRWKLHDGVSSQNELARSFMTGRDEKSREFQRNFRFFYSKSGDMKLGLMTRYAWPYHRIRVLCSIKRCTSSSWKRSPTRPTSAWAAIYGNNIQHYYIGCFPPTIRILQLWFGWRKPAV